MGGKEVPHHLTIQLSKNNIGIFMEVMFEIFIPKEIELDKVGMMEVYNTWGGVNYPQNPAVYEWGNLVKFGRNDNVLSYEKLLGEYVCLSDYYAYTLMDDSLSHLENLVNTGMDVGGDNIFLIFNGLLESIDKWVVLTLIDWDQFDTLHKVNDAKEAFSLLKESLVWSNPKGIALVKDSIK